MWISLSILKQFDPLASAALSSLLYLTDELHWFNFLQWFIIFHHFSKSSYSALCIPPPKFIYSCGFFMWELIHDSSVTLQTLIVPIYRYAWHSTIISFKVLAPQITFLKWKLLPIIFSFYQFPFISNPNSQVIKFFFKIPVIIYMINQFFLSCSTVLILHLKISLSSGWIIIITD